MFRVFSIFAVTGFLLGLAATPVFAESPGSSAQNNPAGETRVADAEALGAAFAKSGPRAERSSETVRQVALDADDSNSARSSATDPNRARRVLGALLAGMGTLETKPSEGIGLPKTAR
jgi:hypothetical protein